MTYKHLQLALSELTEEQLNMDVIVSSGCDANGNAEFFIVDNLTMAMNPDINAAANGIFDDVQPIIQFNEEFEDY